MYARACMHMWESSCGILILPPKGFVCTNSECLCGVLLFLFSWVGISMRMVTMVFTCFFYVHMCRVCVCVYMCTHVRGDFGKQTNSVRHICHCLYLPLLKTLYYWLIAIAKYLNQSQIISAD